MLPGPHLRIRPWESCPGGCSKGSTTGSWNAYQWFGADVRLKIAAMNLPEMISSIAASSYPAGFAVPVHVARMELQALAEAGLDGWSKKRLMRRWHWRFKRVSDLWNEVMGTDAELSGNRLGTTTKADDKPIRSDSSVATGTILELPHVHAGSMCNSPSPPTGELPPKGGSVPGWAPADPARKLSKSDVLEAVERLKQQIKMDLKVHNKRIPEHKVSVTRAWGSRRRGKSSGPSRQLQIARHIVEHGEEVTTKVWTWFNDQKLSKTYGGHGLDTWLKYLDDYTDDALAGVTTTEPTSSGRDIAERAWNRLQSFSGRDEPPGTKWHFAVNGDPNYDPVVLEAVKETWGSWTAMGMDTGMVFKREQFKQAFNAAMKRTNT
jgi:hypothetical protein